MPEGRTANQPLGAVTLRPPISAPFPGALVNLAVIGSPASSFAARASGRSDFKSFFLRRRRRQIHARVIRTAKFLGQFLVPGAGLTSGRRNDLRGEQRENDAVFVRRPNRSVAAEKAGAGALLAAEADRSVEQTLRKPFEADGNFEKLSAEPLDDPIDERAAHQRFADRGLFASTAVDA